MTISNMEVFSTFEEYNVAPANTRVLALYMSHIKKMYGDRYLRYYNSFDNLFVLGRPIGDNNISKVDGFVVVKRDYESCDSALVIVMRYYRADKNKSLEPYKPNIQKMLKVYGYTRYYFDMGILSGKIKALSVGGREEYIILKQPTDEFKFYMKMQATAEFSHNFFKRFEQDGKESILLHYADSHYKLNNRYVVDKHSSGKVAIFYCNLPKTDDDDQIVEFHILPIHGIDIEIKLLENIKHLLRSYNIDKIRFCVSGVDYMNPVKDGFVVSVLDDNFVYTVKSRIEFLRFENS